MVAPDSKPSGIKLPCPKFSAPTQLVVSSTYSPESGLLIAKAGLLAIITSIVAINVFIFNLIPYSCLKLFDVYVALGSWRRHETIFFRAVHSNSFPRLNPANHVEGSGN